MVDASLDNKPWSLGEYIKLHGGSQNRSKKKWAVGIEETVETSHVHFICSL